MPMPPFVKSVDAHDRYQISSLTPVPQRHLHCIMRAHVPRWNVSLNGSQLKILKPVSVPHAKQPAHARIKAIVVPSVVTSLQALDSARGGSEMPVRAHKYAGRTAVLVESHEEQLVLLLAAQVHRRHRSGSFSSRFFFSFRLLALLCCVEKFQALCVYFAFYIFYINQYN